MKKQIIAATALMLAFSSTAYASFYINIFVNGNALNTGAFIMNDSTYIPLRAVSEALGSNVNWDGNTRSVYIDSDEDTVTAQVIENASSSVVAIQTRIYDRDCFKLQRTYRSRYRCSYQIRRYYPYKRTRCKRY